MDAVIATTDLAGSFLSNVVSVVPHGIDLARFKPPADKLAAWSDASLPGKYGIGVFGRVRPDKGTDIFVDAMLRALPQLEGCTAVIAGLTQPKHESYLRYLKRKITDSGLDNRIFFLGEVPAGEIHLWYQKCLLCVACPRYEPFGLTPFEAAASGCALVCSRTGAFDQLVTPGLNGYIVDVEDIDGLSKAVVSIMGNPIKARTFGVAARERVESKFTLAKEAEGVGRVYRELFFKP
jgi:mannosyltransferase